MPLMVTVKIGVGQLTRIIVSRRRKIFSFNEKSYISRKLSLIRIHISDYLQNLVYISNGYAY